MSALSDIYEAWENNSTFREAFKKNPQEALKQHGFVISDEDLIKIHKLLKLKRSSNASNEELDERISK